jgi:transcriptional regulator with XRE-family HTH domain
MGTFIENLRVIMDRNGMTKAELSRLTDISKSTIQQWDKKNAIPKADAAYRVAKALNTSVENLLTGEISVDPAEMYIKKTPGLRSLVIKLGLHPELVGPVDGYLNGYMDSHGYSQEGDKKESQNAG